MTRNKNKRRIEFVCFCCLFFKLVNNNLLKVFFSLHWIYFLWNNETETMVQMLFNCFYEKAWKLFSEVLILFPSNESLPLVALDFFLLSLIVIIAHKLSHKTFLTHDSQNQSQWKWIYRTFYFIIITLNIYLFEIFDKKTCLLSALL